MYTKISNFKENCIFAHNMIKRADVIYTCIYCNIEKE